MPPDSPRRILVTGVGGAPALDLARRLLELGHDVIAADAHPLAPGLAQPGVTARVLPAADHRDYRDALLALCRELRPDALISVVEPELPHLLAMRDALQDLGVRTWLPPRAAVDACLDKARFTTVLAEHALPTPPTWLPDQIDQVPARIPLVVKPRFGQGSKNVYFCQTREQARTLCDLVPDPLIQRRAAGREFTADCLVGPDGRASVILRHRLVVKGGLAVVSRTFTDPQATALVAAALAAITMAGPCCIQGFIHDGAQHRTALTEGNARLAGAFLASEAAGADLVGQLLAGLFGRPIDHARLEYTPHVVLTKYAATLAVTHPAPSSASRGEDRAAHTPPREGPHP